MLISITNQPELSTWGFFCISAVYCRNLSRSYTARQTVTKTCQNRFSGWFRRYHRWLFRLILVRCRHRAECFFPILSLWQFFPIFKTKFLENVFELSSHTSGGDRQARLLKIGSHIPSGKKSCFLRNCPQNWHYRNVKRIGFSNCHVQIPVTQMLLLRIFWKSNIF